MRKQAFITIAVSLIAVGVLLFCLHNAGRVYAVNAEVRDTHSEFRTATYTIPLTFQAYLPFVTITYLTVTQAPQSKYLLVEYWTHREMGISCPWLAIDFPTYFFNSPSGQLTVNMPGNPVLGSDDNAYIGSGTSLGGVGGGAVSHLSNIQTWPYSQNSITLTHVYETGSIRLEREGEIIDLVSDSTWISDEEVESWDEIQPGCIMTSTHYITNYAFQDRDKIIYR